MSRQQVIDDQEYERVHDRVAAIDVAKDSGMVGTRTRTRPGPAPSAARRGRSRPGWAQSARLATSPKISAYIPCLPGRPSTSSRRSPRMSTCLT